MQSNERSRTYEWSDPHAAAEAATKMSGLDFLQAINAGDIPLPPLSHTLNFGKAEITPGQVTFQFDPKEYHYNTLGTVHGGVITAILDTAMGCTLHSTLPVGVRYTTLELKVNFLRAVTIQNKLLFAKGKIVHAGKTTAVVEGQLIDHENKVYAHATCTCLLMQK